MVDFACFAVSVAGFVACLVLTIVRSRRFHRDNPKPVKPVSDAARQ